MMLFTEKHDTNNKWLHRTIVGTVQPVYFMKRNCSTSELIPYQLGKLEFGGDSPRTIRAWCSRFRYFPDPLGIVTAEELDKLEFIELLLYIRSIQNHKDHCTQLERNYRVVLQREIVRRQVSLLLPLLWCLALFAD